MTGRNIFISYASGNFIPARDALCKSALSVGFDEARPRGKENLESKFVRMNNGILSQSRGDGYWLWKPKIILQELSSMSPGDLLVYSDAGRSSYYLFQHFPERLAVLARSAGFLLGPTIGQHGPLARWTKRDAFVLLGVDRPDIHIRAPIQATWSLWTRTPATFEFLEAWLEACCDERMLTDIDNTQGLPNLPDFKGHRHDQALQSLLAYKVGAPYLDYSGKFVERILRLRSQSRLSHLFLKRINDADQVEKRNNFGIINTLIRSWMDI